MRGSQTPLAPDQAPARRAALGRGSAPPAARRSRGFPRCGIVMGTKVSRRCAPTRERRSKTSQKGLGLANAEEGRPRRRRGRHRARELQPLRAAAAAKEPPAARIPAAAAATSATPHSRHANPVPISTRPTRAYERPAQQRDLEPTRKPTSKRQTGSAPARVKAEPSRRPERKDDAQSRAEGEAHEGEAQGPARVPQRVPRRGVETTEGRGQKADGRGGKERPDVEHVAVDRSVQFGRSRPSRGLRAPRTPRPTVR